MAHFYNLLRQIQKAIEQAEDVPQPAIFFTEDGSALIEWADKSAVRSIEVFENGLFELFDMKKNEKQGQHLETKDINEAIRFAINKKGEGP
jgi:hypothetical protein